MAIAAAYYFDAVKKYWVARKTVNNTNLKTVLSRRNAEIAKVEKVFNVRYANLPVAPLTNSRGQSSPVNLSVKFRDVLRKATDPTVKQLVANYLLGK